MAIPDHYLDLLEAPSPSTLVALLAPGSEVPSLADALASLEGSSDVLEVAPGEPAIDGAEWEIDIDVPGQEPGEVQPVRAWLEEAPSDFVLDETSPPSPDERDSSEERPPLWSIVVSTHFGTSPLRDFHRLTRLLAALAPEAILVWDVDSLSARPGHWLSEVAAARTPPSPSTLFTIHDVAPDGDGPHWLHTHGLGRCGALELDVLDVPPDGTGLMGQLINSVASLFMERGIPDPDDPFHAGQDLELVWLPWEDAMHQLPESLAGSGVDRDDAHTGARGVLFRPGEQGYLSPASYLPLLRENPLLYVSDMETERMMLLASERLPRFLRLLSRFSGTEGWMFLVKLGYPVDGAEGPNDREHLWFEVHGYEGGEMDATLLNAPYRIARMHEGQRARHSLDRLSDWSVLCEHGRFDANTVVELERVLAEGPGAH